MAEKSGTGVGARSLASAGQISPHQAGKPTIPSPEKRKATDDGAPQQSKKFAFNLMSTSSKDGSTTEPTKKISMNISLKPSEKSAIVSGDSLNQTKIKAAPIKMSLQTQQKEQAPVKPKTVKLASVFNEEDSDEAEEMPPEAKMRMRNIGRETPTAAGPNSFGKGKLGFCDRNNLFERELKQKMDQVCDD